MITYPLVNIISKSEISAFIRNGWPPWAPLLDRAILFKPCRLERAEFRYLRERVSWIASDLVHRLGVSSDVIISRWETGARHIPFPTERLFRLLVAGVLTNVSLRSLADQLKTPWRQAGEPLKIWLCPEEGIYEYRWATLPDRLPPALRRLFWDTDVQKLDPARHADYIISRVLEKGDLEDWNWLRWSYGEARIARVTRENAKISRQTAHLWQNILLTKVTADWGSRASSPVEF
jgi:DNA-binding transcriptional regulator YiaG